ncbi:MAG: PucR family transcriptional regulator [Pseudomonadota bacterium]
MTTVITRYFDNAEQAVSVRRELVNQRRFPLNILRVYDDPDGLADRLIAADVPPEAAREYQSRMADGGAVLMVRARYKPLGGAGIAREVMAEMGAADLGDLPQEAVIKDVEKPGLSILTDHPHFLLRRRDPSSTNYHMADWPIPLISRRRPFNRSLLSSPHARMADWPIPLLSDRQPYSEMSFPRHKRMADWPIPLLSDRKPYDKSIFPRHARMANFPIPLISRRTPYTGSIFPRHMRMANWPFPLLINRKSNKDVLMPHGRRMADFPIPLLSDREPFTGSIFPRHARMANFPIPLLSRRKPYTGSAIPRHGRMADMILPLVIRRERDARGDRGGFSFSKLLGLPTIIRRA